ncbi:dienelactone hydrolase family protein [Actinomadura sp. CNU-125]|uniref:dienelactone hydrolase family protein n=1 Tax=Actinomadura sp. CNU-125 TaxID=1904961 RepID=UPI0021CCBAF8|nr:dienelactone hydrolase family protein [Actinomadura sp. CNU-125]
MSKSRSPHSVVATLLATFMVLAALLAPGSVGRALAAQENPYERGPAPTAQNITEDGPFAYATATVPAQSGFAGGAIYYPTDTSQGTFGAVAAVPGFLTPVDDVAWMGPRLASHGFVVFTIEPNSRFEFPSGRAAALKAGLTYLTQSSAVRDRVDPTRLAVAGHSMGGGAALEAALKDPNLKAAVALQPWHTGVNFSTVNVPSMIVGAENDPIASPASHAEPFYEQIPAASEKAYLNLAGVGHEVGGVVTNDTQSSMMLTWLKRYVDNDTRYEPFMCPGPSGSSVLEYRGTCPG